jgi:quercetin dioxygenase-like cupin family protein
MKTTTLPNTPSQELLPGYHVKFVHSDSMTFAHWEIEAGAKLPEHSHHHEQVAHVLEGEFELTVDGETQILTPGTIAIVPSNVKHSGKALTKCKMMDTFCPVREEYL